jgi:hypothetical protein
MPSFHEIVRLRHPLCHLPIFHISSKEVIWSDVQRFGDAKQKIGIDTLRARFVRSEGAGIKSQ